MKSVDMSDEFEGTGPAPGGGDPRKKKKDGSKDPFEEFFQGFFGSGELERRFHEIQRALERKVWLKSGGYLVFDSPDAALLVSLLPALGHVRRRRVGGGHGGDVPPRRRVPLLLVP
jgi:hypothetical protein